MSKKSRDQRIGQAAQEWAIVKLQQQGYDVLAADFHNEGFDLQVDHLPIEIKFAHPTQRYRINTSGFKVGYDRWQWNIHDTSHNINRDWCLILIAQDYDMVRFPFILPGGLVGNRNQIQITRHPNLYRGWLKPWLNRWEIITYLLDGTYQDGGPLFKGWIEQVAV